MSWRNVIQRPLYCHRSTATSLAVIYFGAIGKVYVSSNWREPKNEVIAKPLTTSAAPTARHQPVAAYRRPGVYGFATPVDVGPFSTFRCWPAFDLPALAASRLGRRLCSRD